MKRRTNQHRGFTLIEVLLVILILGGLAAVAVVALSGTREGARIDTAKLVITTTLPNALDRYNNDIGHYPSDQEGGLNALVTKPSFDDAKVGDKWRGPYLTEVPQDPWSHDFHYEVGDTTTAGAKPYKVWSDGPDGTSGSADDIKNWTDATQ